jgi:hypothetical protein
VWIFSNGTQVRQNPGSVGVSVGSILKLAGRAAVWRTTPEPRLVGFASLLGFIVVLGVLRVALQFLAAGPHGAFNPYGINALIAWLALEIAVAALVIPAAGRVTALTAMVALLVAAEFIIGAINAAFALAAPAFGTSAAEGGAWINAWVRAAPIAILAVVSLWWIGTMVAVIRSTAPAPRLHAFGRAAAAWVVLAAVTTLIPHAPVFVAQGFDIRTANLWERLYASKLPQPGEEDSVPPPSEAASFEAAQQTLLQAEIGRLAPPKQGATNTYALGIGGWADQDVFLKELDGGLAAIGSVLPIQGHALRLVNHHETTESTPIANQRNFAASVHALGTAMNKDDDVLVLLMTSHGTPTGFSLRLPSGVTTELTPEEVAATLDKEGIKNRIVIVSACFSGAFLPSLANDDTIVLTASDAKSTSFGCAPERDWTYFGDALFRQSIRRGWDLQHAFENARVLISGWEMMDRARPSNPQAHFGGALVAKLAPFFAPPPVAAQ